MLQLRAAYDPPLVRAIRVRTGAASKRSFGKFVLTWYSFQDNTPVNSAITSSGRALVPYVSVAVPFRLLKDFGGELSYGDKLYVAFLDGRTMPNGKKHTGWVQIDDFCGDSGDDSYCFQEIDGKKYPNVDLYVGDFVRSGIDKMTCTGHAGSGNELTDVSTGDPGAEWISDYGGSATGSGACGDIASAKLQQGACWTYTPPPDSARACNGSISASAAFADRGFFDCVSPTNPLRVDPQWGSPGWPFLPGLWWLLGSSVSPWRMLFLERATPRRLAGRLQACRSCPSTQPVEPSWRCLCRW